jgi:hypothetical protein
LDHLFDVEHLSARCQARGRSSPVAGSKRHTNREISAPQNRATTAELSGCAAILNIAYYYCAFGDVNRAPGRGSQVLRF